MKISNHLPHFENATLLVIAGKQEACLFLATRDEINQIHHFKLEKPQYSDNESRRERRGSGGAANFGGGTPFKHDENELTRSFVKQLSESAVNEVTKHNVSQIYLFCPTYLSNQIEDSLPHDLKNKIAYIFYGNYHDQHPFVLLSKIQEYQKLEKTSRIVEPIKPEALKILRNTEGSYGQIANQPT